MANTDVDVVSRSSAGADAEERITDNSLSAPANDIEDQNLRRGKVLPGVVLSVHDEAAVVDVGAEREAFVPRTALERLDDTTRERLEPGAEVMVSVLKPSSTGGELIVSINKPQEQEDWVRADELLRSGEMVEAEVIGSNSGGVLVPFGRLRAFVPHSHLTSIPRRAASEALRQASEHLVGQTLMLKVIEVDRRQNRLLLSERAAGRQRMATLEADDIVTGKVVRLKDYGAFVDLGGVDGLIHISELDHRRVRHPEDLLSEGDEVEVLVKSVDAERERIALSRKALLPNPWDTVEADYQVGDLATGSVTNVVDFGAFVALPNGPVGLLHISQMSTYGVSHPNELVVEGEEVLVRILSIDPPRERMSLSLDAVTSEEQAQWMEARAETEESPSPPDPDEGLAQSAPDPDAELDSGEESDVDAKER